MRVLQAMAGGRFGGAEAFFERLAIAFQERGLEQRALIRRHPERAAKLREAGVEVVELPFGGYLDLKTRRGFGRAVADFRPHLVLTWMSRASRFCPRSSAQASFVRLGRLGGYYKLKYYRGSDHLIVNTQDILRYVVAAGWPAERAHYLPNFVDASPRPPVPRRDLLTPEKVPLLLALGRLHVNKAFDILIHALAELPEAYLWVAGEGPLKRDLEELASRCGVAPRVRFLGWRDDVAGLLAAADVFVCPSRVEPLGNVVIEAWAHGVPVVAAESAGPRALIEPGSSGLLVPIDEPSALAKAVRALIEDPNLARRLAAGGRAAFEASYTEEAVVGRYLDLFEKLIGAPVHPGP